MEVQQPTLSGPAPMFRRLPGKIITGAVFIALMVGLAHVPRADWPINNALFFTAFTIYAVVLFSKPRGNSLKFWLGVAIATRLVLLFIFPQLSDDIYRYIWDGECVWNGINPYYHRPSDLSATGQMTGSYYQMLYENMNSQGYYSVYPPVSQLVFTIATGLGHGSLFWSTLLIKAVLIAAEGAAIYAMYRLLEDEGVPFRILLYALNPLVIIEFSGNAHTEALMICGMLVGIWYVTKAVNRTNLFASALLFAGGIGVKFLPAIAIPSLAKRLQPRRFLVWLMICAVASLFVLAIMLPSIGTRSSESLLLYFDNFEFNAGLYYVLRWIGYEVRGYNMIGFFGPLLAVLAGIGIILYAALEKKPTLSTWPQAIMFAFTIYYLAAPIVHPWYICTIVAFSVFTTFRFPILWSALVFLSYSAYKGGWVDENYWLITLEYSLLYIWLAYEVFFSQRK